MEIVVQLTILVGILVGMQDSGMLGSFHPSAYVIAYTQRNCVRIQCRYVHRCTRACSSVMIMMLMFFFFVWLLGGMAAAADVTAAASFSNATESSPSERD